MFRFSNKETINSLTEQSPRLGLCDTPGLGVASVWTDQIDGTNGQCFLGTVIYASLSRRLQVSFTSVLYSFVFLPQSEELTHGRRVQKSREGNSTQAGVRTMFLSFTGEFDLI